MLKARKSVSGSGRSSRNGSTTSRVLPSSSTRRVGVGVGVEAGTPYVPGTAPPADVAATSASSMSSCSASTGTTYHPRSSAPGKRLPLLGLAPWRCIEAAGPAEGGFRFWHTPESDAEWIAYRPRSTPPWSA